jgi:RHS repeat-associated protein
MRRRGWGRAAWMWLPLLATCDRPPGSASSPEPVQATRSALTTSCVGLANGTPCDDLNACTRTDTCQAGTCTGSNAVQCAAQDTCHLAGTCIPKTGSCTNPPIITGACQLEVFDYDSAGRLSRDHGAKLTYDAYDRLRRVDPAPATPPPIANVPVTDMGCLYCGREFSVEGINNWGHVVGTAENTDGHPHIMAWTRPGPPVDVSNQYEEDGGDSHGYAINDSDTMTGSFTSQWGDVHAFRYRFGSGLSGFQDLGSGGDDGAIGYGINTLGQVAGIVLTGTTVTHGARWPADSSGEWWIYNTLGGTNTWAWGIDDAGTVVGSAQLAASPTTGFAQYGHAIIFDDLVGLRDLNNLVDAATGWTLVVAYKLNGDWVVGTGLISGLQHAYRLRLSNGAVDDLGGGWAGVSVGRALNSYGDAVGYGYLDAANTQQAAWVYSDQFGFKRLSTLVDPASGWDLRDASGINDAGDIVGTGMHDGVLSTYRLSLPLRVPAPTGPTVAVAHAYAYDGERVATTVNPGVAGAKVQFWFTPDYTEHDGQRDHYLRVGSRLVAKISYRPPGAPAMGLQQLRDQERSNRSAELVDQILVMLLAAGCVAISLGGLVGRKRRRRPAWVAATTGPACLFFLASCEMLGYERRSAQTLWQRVDSVFFHQGPAAGPVLTTSASGALLEERRYDPFGAPIDAAVSGVVGAVDFRREPQNALGKLTNAETGWSYHGARWMSPQTARWISPDPEVKGPQRSQVVHPWDLNPYHYASQAPTYAWDPDGATPKGMLEIYLPGRGDNIWVADPWRKDEGPRHPASEFTIESRSPSGVSTVERGQMRDFIRASGNPAVQSQLGKQGIGWARAAENLGWGRKGTIEKVKLAGARFNDLTQGKYYLVIGGIGPQGGGSNYPHKLHDDGRDMDVYVYDSETRKAVNHMSSDPKIVGALQSAVDAFRRSGGVNVQVIFFNNPAVSGVDELEHHDDHLHVRVHTESAKPSSSYPP